MNTDSYQERLKRLLGLAVSNHASDLHLVAGLPPMLRINGELAPLPGENALDKEDSSQLVYFLLADRKEEFLKEKELDFSYLLFEDYSFRANAYYQQDTVAASLRLVPRHILTIEELNLPLSFKSLVKRRQGLILITGPAGHGKSTTVAALLGEINRTRSGHIITLEDPIEYRIATEKCLVSQREIKKDTLSWSRALRSCLREDPDVVFIGEMRDLETISAALTIAETGHLVVSTLHTNSAPETVDRIIDVFPSGSKDQVRIQLANVLVAVISQRLVPTIRPGRLPVTEVLLSDTAVKTAIRDAKTHLIDNIIQMSSEVGMTLLETSLADLVKRGLVDREVAEGYAIRKEELIRSLRHKNV